MWVDQQLSHPPFSRPPSLPATAITLSPDGTILATVTPEGIALRTVDAPDAPPLHTLALRGASAAAFSAGGSYIVCYARPPPKSATLPPPDAPTPTLIPNLGVWRVKDGERLLALSHRGPFRADAWPLTVGGASDTTAVHMVNAAVHVFDLGDASPSAVAAKLPLKGVCAAATSPDGTLLAAAVPDAKGVPGYVGVWKVADLPAAGTGAGAAAGAPPPLARRTVFRASSVGLLWSPSSNAVLACVATEGGAAAASSYYGDVKLHYLCAADKPPPSGKRDCLVPLPKDGPVHDVAWSPRGDAFVALAGYMPARATVFDAGCTPVYDLGSGPHALARWSPHARFLALAGFGNLAGDVAIFDRKADGKLKPCGGARVENGVSAEWAPDGRTLLVATVTPRLRVDNGLRLIKYDGTLLASRPYPVLLDARWRPTPADAFPDRLPSPRGGGGAGGPAKPAPAKPARPVAFVPPHLRGQPGTQRAVRMLGQEDDTGPRKISAAAPAGPVRRLPPGAVPVTDSKAASKNAKRRAAAAAKKKAEAEGGA